MMEEKQSGKSSKRESVRFLSDILFLFRPIFGWHFVTLSVFLTVFCFPATLIAIWRAIIIASANPL